MSASNSPVGHHTSHTMGNGASSSSSGVLGDASHPIGHHTSHTMGNGAASGSSGASQCGGSTFNGQPQGTVETSVTRPPTTVEQFISSIRDNMTETGEDDEPAVLKQVPSLVSLADSISRDSYVSDAGIDTVATSMFSTGNTANFSIIDTTLREGEQFATAFFTTEEKLQIARALDDIGVEYIEVTSPAASEKSRTDCEAICKLGLKAKILCHIRCHMDDARIAVQTGVDGINMCIGTSPQLMKHSHGKDMSFIAAKAQEIVDFVRSNNIEVRFSGEDSFRSDFNDILNLYSLVDSLGANRVGIADTVGGATAREVYEKISKLRSTVGCDIETHFHNDTGCAVSNALTALEAGATHIDTTVLGIGERNGITPLGALMMALMPFEREHILSKYKVEKLPELERLVAKLVGVEIPFNTPVIPTDI